MQGLGPNGNRGQTATGTSDHGTFTTVSYTLGVNASIASLLGIHNGATHRLFRYHNGVMHRLNTHHTPFESRPIRMLALDGGIQEGAIAYNDVIHHLVTTTDKGVALGSRNRSVG